MFGKRKSVKAKKTVYTDEQLRYMIAPPVLGSVARSILAEKFATGITSVAANDNVGATSPLQSIPIIGTIGNSARSSAQLKAYREKARER